MRALSSILVVVLGILPAAFGTVAFAVFMTVLGVLGWREYGQLTEAAGTPVDRAALILGSLSVVAFAIVALTSAGWLGILVATTVATYAPMVSNLGRSPIGAFGSFQTHSFGAFYLGIPVFSAVVLREMPGETGQKWFTSFASDLAWFGAAAPRGLAVILTVVLAVWLSDTVAYLAGSTFGRHRLAPHISPGKSVEGSAAGLLASVVTGACAFAAFGAGPWHAGAVLGFASGVAGQIGDLSESLMKRQAGVKDSGTLIPGHGGILDRIDALLFAFPAALIVVQAQNWFDR